MLDSINIDHIVFLCHLADARWQKEHSMLEDLIKHGFSALPTEIEDAEFIRIISGETTFSVLLERRGDRWVVHGDFGWEARHNLDQLRNFLENTPNDLIVVDCSDASLLVNCRKGETWETLDNEELFRRADRYPVYHSKGVIGEALAYNEGTYGN